MPCCTCVTPSEDLAVRGTEVVESAARRRVAEEAWRLQPWYAEQPYSLEQWVADSPMVLMTPTPSEG